MDPAQLITLATNTSVSVALVVFFVWRDRQREVSRENEIKDMADFQRDTLVTLVQSTTQALTESSSTNVAATKAIEELSHTNRNVLQELKLTQEYLKSRLNGRAP
jgi:hypothetical protein